MHRNTNRAGLVGNRASDGLSNPPGRVSRELVTAPVFKFLNGLHEAHISFLDQIEKRKSSIGVFFGNRDNQSQVGFDHFFFSLESLAVPDFEILMVGLEFIRRKPETNLHILKFCSVLAADFGAVRFCVLGQFLLDIDN